MAQSIANRVASTPLNSLDAVRPQMARATLDGQSRSIELTAIVKDVLIRHHGSLKAVAIDIGMDQGQLTRELQTGDFKLKRLEGTDGRAAVLAALGKELVEQYGELADPKDRTRRVLKTIVDLLREVEQYVEVA